MWSQIPEAGSVWSQLLRVMLCHSCAAGAAAADLGFTPGGEGAVETWAARARARARQRPPSERRHISFGALQAWSSWQAVQAPDSSLRAPRLPVCVFSPPVAVMATGPRPLAGTSWHGPWTWMAATPPYTASTPAQALRGACRRIAEGSARCSGAVAIETTSLRSLRLGSSRSWTSPKRLLKAWLGFWLRLCVAGTF